MSLRDYYHEHGESEHLALVEGALDHEWRRAAEIAELAHKSENFTRLALSYLVEEGRAEFGQSLVDRPRVGKRWMQMWRLPEELEAAAEGITAPLAVTDITSDYMKSQPRRPLPGEPKLDPDEPVLE